MGFFDKFFKNESKQESKKQAAEIPNENSKKDIPSQLDSKALQETSQQSLDSISQISPIPKSEKSLKKLAEELAKQKKSAVNLQLKIDKTQDSDKTKFSNEKTTLQNQISNLELKIAEQRTALNEWIAKTKAQLEQVRPELEKNKQFQLLKNDLSNAEKQIIEYAEFIKKQDMKIQVKIEAQEKEARKAVEAKEKTYNEAKDAVKRLVNSVIADPKELGKILQPLLSSSKEKGGIGWTGKLQTGVKTVGFVLSNEDLKFSDIYTVSGLDATFYSKFLQDKDFGNFLNSRLTGKLDEIVKELVPTLAAIAVRELTNESAIKNELESKKKELDGLLQLKGNLEALEAQLKNPNSNLGEQEKSKLAKEISSLQLKIAPLQDLFDKAERVKIFKTLESAGLGQEYIMTKLVPIITDISNKVLINNQNLVLLIRSAATYALTNDQQEKKVALRQILSAIDTETFLKDSQVVQFLQQEGQTLAKGTIAVASSNETIKSALYQYGVTDTLVTDIIPIITQTAGNVLANSAQVQQVFKVLVPIILDDTNDRLAQIQDKDPEMQTAISQERVQKVTALANALSGLVLQDNVLSAINTQLVPVIEGNKNNILKIVTQLLTSKKSNTLSTPATEITQSGDNEDKAPEVVSPQSNTSLFEKLTSDTYQEVISLGIDIAKSSIPLLTQTAAAFAKDTQRVNAVVNALTPVILDDTTQRLQNIEDLAERNQLEVERTKKILNLAKVVPRLILQDNVVSILNTQLVGLLETNKANISNLAATIVPKLGLNLPEGMTPENYQNIASVGIDVAKSAIPLLTQTAAAFAKDSVQVNNIIAAYTQFTEYKKLIQEFNNENEDKTILKAQQQQLTRGLLAQGTEILNGSSFQELITKSLPKYLTNSADSIAQSEQLTNIFRANTQLLKENGIDIHPVVAKEGIKVGLKFVSAALPVLNEIAQNSLSQPDKIMEIMNNVNDLMTEDSKTKRTPEQEKAFKAEKTKKISTLVSTIIDFKNANPKLKNAIDQELPKLLKDHSEALGSVIDEVLKNTTMGRKLDVKAEAIIKVASNHLPQITEVANLYSKRKYAAMIPKVAQLIFNKDVMQLAGKAIFGLIKPKTLSHGKAIEHHGEISAAAKVLTNNKSPETSVTLKPQSNLRQNRVNSLGPSI